MEFLCIVLNLTHNCLTAGISALKGVKFSADFSTETGRDAEEVPGKGCT